MSEEPAPLLRDFEDGVSTLTLHRPDRLNAVSLPLYRALIEALREATRDPAVRALVLTGSGRAFCAGADLRAYAGTERSDAERIPYIRAAQRANLLLQRIPKPVVAAVNGAAVGAGLELALSADFLIVASDAKLRLPEVALGTFVGGGVTYTLVQRVGLARAKELIMLGDFFSGDDAAEWALANRAVPAEEVLDASLELARRLAAMAPLSLGYAKRLLGTTHRLGSRKIMRREAKALLACMRTRDWREGIDAFSEKRPPKFTGE